MTGVQAAAAADLVALCVMPPMRIVVLAAASSSNGTMLPSPGEGGGGVEWVERGTETGEGAQTGMVQSTSTERGLEGSRQTPKYTVRRRAAAYAAVRTARGRVERSTVQYSTPPKPVACCCYPPFDE